MEILTLNHPKQIKIQNLKSQKEQGNELPKFKKAHYHMLRQMFPNIRRIPSPVVCNNKKKTTKIHFEIENVHRMNGIQQVNFQKTAAVISFSVSPPSSSHANLLV